MVYISRCVYGYIHFCLLIYNLYLSWISVVTCVISVDDLWWSKTTLAYQKNSQNSIPTKLQLLFGHVFHCSHGVSNKDIITAVITYDTLCRRMYKKLRWFLLTLIIQKFLMVTWFHCYLPNTGCWGTQTKAEFKSCIANMNVLWWCLYLMQHLCFLPTCLIHLCSPHAPPVACHEYHGQLLIKSSRLSCKNPHTMTCKLQTQGY